MFAKAGIELPTHAPSEDEVRGNIKPTRDFYQAMDEEDEEFDLFEPISDDFVTTAIKGIPLRMPVHPSVHASHRIAPHCSAQWRW